MRLARSGMVIGYQADWLINFTDASYCSKKLAKSDYIRPNEDRSYSQMQSVNLANSHHHFRNDTNFEGSNFNLPAKPMHNSYHREANNNNSNPSQ